MLEDIQKYLSHYLWLAGLLTGGIVGVIFFRQNQTALITVLGVTGIGYVIWGIIHHNKEEDLTFTLVLEYILTALLTIILVGGVLQSV